MTPETSRNGVPVLIIFQERSGVTGESIPPAGLYPGLKRPRLDIMA